jgi:tRNA pseudouridine55 synthase
MNPDKNSRQPKMPIDGLLLLNKPAGITSNRALQQVKRLLNAKKAGHTGSLDPAATGMLPLCFGEATKVCAYLLAADKTYRVTAKLGEASNTGDADGEIIETKAVPSLSVADWEALLAGFLGESRQIPPMHSALKKDGKRLYELARRGEVVEREPRPIRIDSIELLEAHGTRLVFRVKCSKGTYVRSMVEDIATAAGTVAHTLNLHRESVGDFRAEDMLDMPGAIRAAESGPEALQKHLLTPDSALAGWDNVQIPATDAERFSGGQQVPVSAVREAAHGELVRVYDNYERFRGVGEICPDGKHVAPRRIFRLAAESSK